MNKKYSLEIGREEKKHYLYVDFCKVGKPSEIYLKRKKYILIMLVIKLISDQ